MCGPAAPGSLRNQHHVRLLSVAGVSIILALGMFAAGMAHPGMHQNSDDSAGAAQQRLADPYFTRPWGCQHGWLSGSSDELIQLAQWAERAGVTQGDRLTRMGQVRRSGPVDWQAGMSQLPPRSDFEAAASRTSESFGAPISSLLAARNSCSFRSRKPSREEQALADYEVRIVGGEKAAATEERPSAKHIASIASAAKTVSDRMNFDADRIDIVEVEPHTFEVGGRMVLRGAFYDPATGRIEINARTNVPDGPDNLVKELVAHEITHAQQDAVDNVMAQEHEAIRELSREEFDRLFMTNGFPRKEVIAEIEKRFPASAAMAKSAPTGDSYLGTWSKGTDGKWAFDENAYTEDGGRMERMANENGLTAYRSCTGTRGARPTTRW